MNNEMPVNNSPSLNQKPFDGAQGKPPVPTWLLWTGVAVVALIVGVLIALAIPSVRKSVLSSSAGKSVSGMLPVGGASPTPDISTSVSGLSGRACADANRRPIGVMLAGDPINRPLSGFSQADLVLEMPVLTSDVTRLTAIYQCGRPTEMGSVRSARHDYLYMIEGWDGILGHWGGSYWALNMIKAGQFQTINALENPYDSFYRKNNLPAPYNGFTSYDRLWNALQKLGYRTTTTFPGYSFKDNAAVDQRGAAGSLSIAWPGAFAVRWDYDPTTNTYVRFWAGVKQTDPENKQVVAPSTIAIMRATDEFADGPGGYNDMGIEGTGEATVYQDGQVIKGTWKKDINNKKDPVHFMDESGKPITFTRGQVWVMAVEPNISITWTQKTAQ